MSDWKRHFWIAIIGGIAVSGALFCLNFAIDPAYHPTLGRIVSAAQFPGWIACAVVLPGSFESSNTASYVGIAVPVNAALYATVILVTFDCWRWAGGRRSVAKAKNRE